MGEKRSKSFLIFIIIVLLNFNCKENNLMAFIMKINLIPEYFNPIESLQSVIQ